MAEQAAAVKEAWLSQLVSLLTMVLLLGAQAAATAGGNQVKTFRAEAAGVLATAVAWCQGTLSPYLPNLTGDAMVSEGV
jgi:hypothetical protein